MPMKLVTKEIEAKLLENGRNREQDHVPVLKIFDPSGAATWLFNELDEDRVTLFGLCDLGFGFPELGYANLEELASVRNGLGLPLERDLHFEGKHPMSTYTRAARAASGIVDQGPELDRAAAPLLIDEERAIAEFDNA